ncbi:MAG TPA: hypothetical protein VNR87_04400 [Flavisolibacter sp.]|nr:hypothetical protein [Flavisolibacter sp.]
MHQKHFWRKVLGAGLLVGTLDITSALIHFMIRTGRDPMIVLKYISSAVLGKTALTGGTPVVVLGFVLHFMIAYAFTILFFLFYPKLGPLSKNRLITGILYGLFIWTVMNRLLVPMTRVSVARFNWTQAIINMLILIVAIGLPLSWLAYRYYRRKQDVKGAMAQAS